MYEWRQCESCGAASGISASGGLGPFLTHWLEDFTFLSMSLEKMPWRNWKGLES
jgi:hypothetical protein